MTGEHSGALWGHSGSTRGALGSTLGSAHEHSGALGDDWGALWGTREHSGMHTRGNPDDSDEEESDFKALEQFIEGEHRCSVRQAEDFSFVLSA